MKITVNKDVFLEKINIASRFISSKFSSSTPLEGILLKGDKDKVHFYSTNLNFYYHSFIKIENNQQFKIVIEPKKISEFLSLLPQGNIDIEIKDKKIIISKEKAKGEFPFFSHEDFPTLLIKEVKKQKIKIDFLKKNLSLILFSASNDETRPVLTGVNFVLKDDGVQIVATDGFRLSLLNLKEQLPFSSSIIVPANFFLELFRLNFTEGEVFFDYQEKEKLLGFFVNEDELYTRLIEGDYPPYEKVIPIDKKTTVIVGREEFLRNIKLISVFARDFSNVVILDIEKQGIKISPKTEEGKENVAFQEAEAQGEELKIAFNYKFLIDFLNNIKSERIIIELLRSDSPTVFKIEKNDDFLHVIMPVRIQE